MNEAIQKLFDLKGEVAIVTGGLGQLGSEYVKTLASAGASVAIFDIADQPKPKVQKMLDEGLPISVYKVDITDKKEVKRLYAEVAAKFGAPTILINNAGIDASPNVPVSGTGAYEDFPEEIWDAVIDSHLKGMFLMSQEFLRAIKGSNKKGSIINISSTYGLVSPDQSIYDSQRQNGATFFKPVAYSVAKSGVLNFTRWLAEYCRQAGIAVRVNTFVPGGVFNNQPEEFLEEYNKRTILGRMAREDEYNAAILFLASNNASSYMTGSMLVVDGGWTAR